MEIRELNHFDVLQQLPDRCITAHKGNFGKILLLCGSRGYTGAAALAAMGALRSGAGLVYLGVPESIYPIMATKLTEPVVFPLEDSDGHYGSGAIAQITPMLSEMHAVLIGPGLGRSRESCQMVQYILENFSGPVVLDADGINLMKQHKDVLRGRTGITVLTPHEGEFSRFGCARSGDRIADAMYAASDLHCIMVLKGHGTIITDGAKCFRNPTGNPGMAVGGSGDILAGMIVSLLGQKIPPLMASACAVWLHGAAGDRCAAELGQYGMLPTDMLQVLSRLMK